MVNIQNLIDDAKCLPRSVIYDGPMVFSVRTVLLIGLSSGALMRPNPIANAIDAAAVIGALMI